MNLPTVDELVTVFVYLMLALNFLAIFVIADLLYKRWRKK